MWSEEEELKYREVISRLERLEEGQYVLVGRHNCSIWRYTHRACNCIQAGRIKSGLCPGRSTTSRPLSCSRRDVFIKGPDHGWLTHKRCQSFQDISP